MGEAFFFFLACVKLACLISYVGEGGGRHEKEKGGVSPRSKGTAKSAVIGN